MDNALTHFAELARQGTAMHASSGEVRAHRLAQAILLYAGGLDQRAVEGLIEFTRLATTAHAAAKQLVKTTE